MTIERPVRRYHVNLRVAAPYRGRFDPKVLRAAARATLAHQSAPAPSELSVLVTGDLELRALNRAYLGHDRPTDVLSFAAREPDPTTGRLYLGDIAIAYPHARAQARAGGHPVKAELQLLVVHGVLHLLGFDHAYPQEKARMWAAQSDILARLRSAVRGPA